jgi:hypothetical protein
VVPAMRNGIEMTMMLSNAFAGIMGGGAMAKP